MRKLNGVAYSINMLMGCLQIFIHPDTAHLANPQSGSLSQAGLCPYANAEQHYIGLQTDTRFEVDGQLVSLA